jgi:hypothetical protein
MRWPAAAIFDASDVASDVSDVTFERAEADTTRERLDVASDMSDVAF